MDNILSSFVNKMTTRPITKYIFYSSPAVVFFIVVASTHVGLLDFILIGIYGLVAISMLPVGYKLASSDKKNHKRSGQPITHKKIIIIFILLITTLLFLTARVTPRPTIFFVAISTLHVLIILLISRDFLSPITSMCLIVLINGVYFISTTLGGIFYFGSGDMIAVWVGIVDSINSGHISPTAGYNDFPAYFSLMSLSGTILGAEPHVALFSVSAVLSIASLFLIYYFSRVVGKLNKKNASISAALVLLMYPHFYEGLYSIPRTFTYYASLLPMVIMLAVVLNRIKLSNRFFFILLLSGLTLSISHKGEQLLPIGLIFSFILLYNLFYEKNIQKRLRLVCLAIIPGIIFYSYITSSTQIPISIVSHVFLTSVSTEGSGGLAIDSPLAFGSTFMSTSVILLLFIISIYSILSDKNRYYYPIILFSVIFSVLFFPGPAHLTDSILTRRSAKYLVPFVALLCAFGLSKLELDRNKIYTGLFVFLLLSSSFFAFSNDMYSRDNPTLQTDTFSNYLTDAERSTIDFSRDYSDQKTVVDIQLYMFANRFQSQSNTYTGPFIDLAMKNSMLQECERNVIIRSRELNQRGKVIYPESDLESPSLASESVTFESIHSIDDLVDNDSVIYSNNHSNIHYSNC